MKYCVPYSQHFKYSKEVDEIMFMYDEWHNQSIVHTLAEMAEEFKGQRVIIQVLDYDYFVKWKTALTLIDLKQKEINFAVAFQNYTEDMDETLSQLKENNIPFFFMTRVSNWDTFNGLIKLGVSDIYIVEELGFELNKLGPLAHASSVSIRTFANVCQTQWKKGDSLKSFFIRPEDVSIYEPYVDVLEFFGDTNAQEVMYKVYAIDKQWFGNLKEIIIGLDIDLDSRFVLPAFGAARAKCGKKCLKGINCQICDRIMTASKTFEKKGIYFKNV